MDDPFSTLQKNLESVFHLVPMRNGKYAYPEIQQLKDAIENYQTHERTTFIALVKAFGATLPHLEKLQINFEPVKNSIKHAKNSIDTLAKLHQMPVIYWDKFLTQPKVSSRLFNALNTTQQEQELIPWLNTISGELFTKLNPTEQAQILVDNREELGFNIKLSAHLKKDPQFLSRLIMQSESNFIKITNTRLSLYLTDKQIAKAIINYLPNLLHEQEDPLKQVEQLVDRLNGILSNGRSISTLLRNVEAKEILDGSDFFRIYQTDEYKNNQENPSFLSEGKNVEPNF